MIPSYFIRSVICQAGSLLVRASSNFMDSTLPDYDHNLRQPHQHHTDGAATVPEKLMQDLRSRAVPSASIQVAGGMNEHTDTTLDVVIPYGHGVFGHRGHLRYETDASGVRVAGGRAGVMMPADDFDQQSASEDGSTLPPPHSSDYGDP